VAAAASAAGISQTWVSHAVTDAQSATTLTAETIDSTVSSSRIYEVEIIRGTTVISNGRIWLQDLNGTWQVELGVFSGVHGVTFSVTQVTTVGTLQAALDTGAGNGTIKLSQRDIAI
jgi:hypothetical protein